ncbi:MAG: SIS domain-containing protein [Fervidobacterium sp.]
MISVLRQFGINAKAYTSGEFLVNGKLLDKVSEEYDTAILISRTGTTTETVESAKKLSRKMETIGISCEKNTPLSSVCSEKIELDFAREKSVVMTGSFSAILRLLLKGILRRLISPEPFLALYQRLLNEELVGKKDYFVFLGYNERYYIAKESALKVQEMAPSCTEYYEPLEYRHGPIARLSEKTHVTIFSTGS